jgi:hypothetical protein
MHRPGRPAIAATAAALLTLSIAACSGSASPAAPTAPEPSTVPTTPASEAPAGSEAAAGGAAEPTEKLIASDGRIIVYPPGWWTKEDMGIVYVASSEDAANALVMSGSLAPGQSYVQLGQNSILSGGTTDPAVHLPDNLKMLLEGQGMTAGAPATITVAGKPAARLSASNDKLQLIAVSVRVRDDLFADVIGYGAPGEEAALEKLVLTMVEGMTFPAP